MPDRRAGFDLIREAVDQFPSQTTVTLDKDDVRTLLDIVDAARRLMRVGYDDGPEEAALVAALRRLGTWPDA
jgi:hypothetical protein